MSKARKIMPDQNITPRQSPTTPEGKTSTNAKKHFFRAAAADFKKIPGSPIAYWVSNRFFKLYFEKLLNNIFEAKEGVGTRDDENFMRLSWEVSKSNVAKEKRWILTDKAGDFRKWFLGFNYLMDWENDGYRIRNYRNSDGSLRSRPQNTQYLFREGVSWGKIGSGKPSFRYRPEGYGFNDAAPTLFGKNLFSLLGSLNSKIVQKILEIRGSTINITTGVVLEIPSLENFDSTKKEELVIKAVNVAKFDWDSYETSWDFGELPLLRAEFRQDSLEQTYEIVREHWKQMCLEMKRLEEENNRIFIEAYGLQDELTPEVPWREITLTCNPFYRYSKKAEASEDTDEAQAENDEAGSEIESPAEAEDDALADAGAEFPCDAALEERLLGDTMRELISYAVGCMFGRYSLDKPGLILADQGQGVEEYLQQVPEPSFTPDRDNVLPILEEEYFIDDIAERFKKFIKVAFGEASYQKNLEFIEKAIGKDIRRYFLKDFYNDHVKRYKKRPIYWLFSSPNGSFNALIYMHRYRHDTPSQVLNHYLRVYIEKINTRNRDLEQLKLSASASPRDQNQAAKEIDRNKKILRELETYEREIVFPLAARRLEIDLDNGVKNNYPLFGKALKKITGI